MYARARTRALVSVPIYVRARMCLRACVRACVFVCVCARARVCLCVCARAPVSMFWLLHSFFVLGFERGYALQIGEISHERIRDD